ncbi:protein FAM81A isoform X2 [Callorhinchus milii]|uniref:protein FAM81A isoform X2 n=1 Tax=Callorhinchus milii TaxID=7868 RepID=UPI001C3F5C49|nr:protein FAM81A isoform X2 [Callorhinchus milii]
MKNLLGPTSCIGDDNVPNLHGAKCKDEEESKTWRVLEEHIRYTAFVVNQLSRDIEILQEQIQARDSVSYATNTAVKTLEMRHLNGMGDLRGRVARCDASISKLSADLVTIHKGIQSLSNEQQKVQVILEAKIKDVEWQISQLLRRIEKSIAELEAKIRLREGHSNQQLHLLDDKIKLATEEIKEQIFSGYNRLEEEQEKKAKELLRQIKLFSLLIDDKTESRDREVEERFIQLAVKLVKIEEIQKRNLDFLNEENLNARITNMERKIWNEIEVIKTGTNIGFATTYESIGSVRQMLEANIKLDRDHLQKHVPQTVHQDRKDTTTLAE